jgi:hypothetical protein|tara:strand:+ start:882 stop:1673 length:792 start_codon:yes stop_codon:yes gene_type:complete
MTNVITIDPQDTETLNIVPGPATMEHPRVRPLDQMLELGHNIRFLLDADGNPALVSYTNQSTGTSEHPIDIGKVIIMSDHYPKSPLADSYKSPYEEALRQGEDPSLLVFHGTNIDSLLYVIDTTEGIMKGKLGNWFASHELEKMHLDNPDLKHQIQKPGHSSVFFAELGKYNTKLKKFVPITLRFLKGELPQLEEHGRTYGINEHYTTKEKVQLSALTLASKIDVINLVQFYKHCVGADIDRQGAHNLAYSLGFNQNNFFIKQ